MTRAPAQAEPAQDVLVLAGPTASGKTPVSILLAAHLGGEIISADSRQMYRLMDIGTAKPSSDERRDVPHYFIDDRMPDQECNAAEFGAAARARIGDILARRRTPIVVGGSGLYLRALLDGLFDAPPADGEFRAALWRRLEELGADALLAELREVDPAAAARMLPSNTKRIVRALEVYHHTGVPISKLHARPTAPAGFRAVCVGIAWDRPALYDRINRRVDRMLDDGLIDEVKEIVRKGYPRTLNALQTVGYREVFDFLDGATTYLRMAELIKQNSRRYAKRQLTWFRHDPRITWFTVQGEEEFPALASRIERFFRSGGAHRSAAIPLRQKVL